MADPSLYVTDTPGPASTLGDTCVWEIRQEYDVIPTLVCSICLSVGLVYCFFGYRCFKMVMFLSGFMLGSAVVCLLSLVQKDSVPDTELGLGTKAGISLGVGVLCGLLTMLVSTLGLFLTGLQLGGVLSGAALLAVAQFHPTLSPWWAPLGALLATSVLCALLTLRWQKPLTVGSTAVVGASAVALSVDYLVEAFPLAVHLGDAVSGVAPYPLCWISGALMGIAPALSLAGVLVQWRVTAVGVSHSEWAEFRKQQAKAEAPTSALQYRRSHRRAPSQRRRGPPPLRRYAGDVLAPSYIRSLQERQMGTGSSSSSSTVSTVTCTVIDLDFETGSMAPLTASSPGFRL
ncbi:transmembrane protein 198-like [Gadus chalcogrammus]|uniref:transmembrane protein 198-like n=1 Tax=Gadus chalcogrammus TaxID=1042646 RepID=UPI0024C28B30|nr:transmembrane protein 198-like [Gadus chalcogrammus]